MKFHKTSTSGSPGFQYGGAERTDMKKVIVAFRIVERCRMITALIQCKRERKLTAVTTKTEVLIALYLCDYFLKMIRKSINIFWGQNSELWTLGQVIRKTAGITSENNLLFVYKTCICDRYVDFPVAYALSR